MIKRSAFHLTRRAALDLREIYDRSVREWGEATADPYIRDIYDSMNRAATDSDIGLLRKHRSAPFRMVPARQHFVIYDCIPDGIVVLTIIHQVRDIERLLGGLSQTFLREIESLRSKVKGAEPRRRRKFRTK
jgi:plasmid stabilization system protein ParE